MSPQHCKAKQASYSLETDNRFIGTIEKGRQERLRMNDLFLTQESVPKTVCLFLCSQGSSKQERPLLLPKASSFTGALGPFPVTFGGLCLCDLLALELPVSCFPLEYSRQHANMWYIERTRKPSLIATPPDNCAILFSSLQQSISKEIPHNHVFSFHCAV